jgi:DNA helicase-2/ATP-dependent DNA helicase PcrA
LLREIDYPDTVQIFIDGLKLKEQYNSVAIITKTQAEADAFKDTISQMNIADKVRIVTKRDKTFLSDKLMVIPAYLAKGLEFDAVLIANASSDVYTLAERNLFYVAVTRALHKLNIYYTKEITPLVSANAIAECEKKDTNGNAIPIFCNK